MHQEVVVLTIPVGTRAGLSSLPLENMLFLLAFLAPTGIGAQEAEQERSKAPELGMVLVEGGVASPNARGCPAGASGSSYAIRLRSTD